MAIIKNQQVLENTWTFVADDAELVAGDISVSLERWLAEQNTLLQHKGQVAVRVQGTSDLSALRPSLKQIPVIEVEFPSFTDGRSFSQARLLRDREGYTGEIRAVGGFHADQVFYLQRVGVDSFVIENEKQQQVALEAFNDFTVSYQASTR